MNWNLPDGTGTLYVTILILINGIENKQENIVYDVELVF